MEFVHSIVLILSSLTVWEGRVAPSARRAETGETPVLRFGGWAGAQARTAHYRLPTAQNRHSERSEESLG